MVNPKSLPVVSRDVKFSLERDANHYENDRVWDYIIEVLRLMRDEGKMKISSCWIGKIGK